MFYFPDFNVDAMRVIQMAQDEMRTMGHSYLGTESIVVGALQWAHENKVPHTRIHPALENVTLSSYRKALREVIGHGSGYITQMPFTPRCQAAMKSLVLASNGLVTLDTFMASILEDQSSGAWLVLTLASKPKST